MTSTLTDRRYGVAEGLAWKVPCRLSPVGNHSLSGLANIDGATPAEGERILVNEKDDARPYGIYLASSGLWQRSPDFDGNRDIVTGTRVNVHSGSTKKGVYRVTSA